MSSSSGRALRASEPQAVTFVELFFDLVFVFAVTQITALTAHDLTVGGVVRSVLLFWLVWWAWTQFTWTLNPADTTHPGVRVVTLAATAAAFVMATGVARAFADDALWFAVPYVVVRVLGLALQVRIDLEHAEADHVAVSRWATMSALGLGLVLAGALAEPSVRSWVWLLAILADLLAAAVAGRAATWDLNPAHVSERHGLFVIIALGESLIVAAIAVAEEPRTSGLVSVAAAALAVTGLLWWSYFGWLKDALEHRLAQADASELGRLTRDAFSLAHFPLVCGIIGFAVGIEEIAAHPDDPAPAAVVGSLGTGVALFVGFSALAYRRLGGPLLAGRLVMLPVLAVLLALVAPLAPAWTLVVVACLLLAVVLLEARQPGLSPAAHDADYRADGGRRLAGEAGGGVSSE